MALYSASDLSNDTYYRAKVACYIDTIVDDPANNQSTINWYFKVSDGNSNYGGYNYNNPDGQGGRLKGSVGIGTAVGDAAISGTYTYNAAGTTYGSYDFGDGVISSPYFPRTTGTYAAIITHDTATGKANVSMTGTFTGGSGPAGTATATIGSTALTDFSGPGTPAAPTVTRSGSTPGTITITSASTTSGSTSITKYQYSVSTSSTGTGTPGTLSGATPVSVTSTTGYYVKTRAISWDGGEGSWGYGAWSPTTFIAGIPTAPGTPSISNVVANSLTLTWTAPSSDGGATVSSYKVQVSTDNGSTWTTKTTGITFPTTLTANLTGLAIAATYKFRIIATNSTGDSAAGTASVAQFISAYGYRYDGSTFIPITNAKIYVGVGGPGADANGWRTVQNIQKYGSGGWTSLQA
jgi:hypothetical protein